jgi:hypothetical protein
VSASLHCPESAVSSREQAALSSKSNISPVHPADNLAMLGASRQGVRQLTEEDPSLPKPAAGLATGRVWETADIEKWAKATGREIQ